jgi:toxin ParE1/3/4
MSFTISDHAEEDIIAIFLWGLATLGRSQADSYHDGLLAMFDLLAEFPQSARERSEVQPPVRIQPYQSHVVVYEIVDDGILILRVRHGHEDWTANPAR